MIVETMRLKICSLSAALKNGLTTFRSSTLREEMSRQKRKSREALPSSSAAWRSAKTSRVRASASVSKAPSVTIKLVRWSSSGSACCT